MVNTLFNRQINLVNKASIGVLLLSTLAACGGESVIEDPHSPQNGSSSSSSSSSSSTSSSSSSASSTTSSTSSSSSSSTSGSSSNGPIAESDSILTSTGTFTSGPENFTKYLVSASDSYVNEASFTMNSATENDWEVQLKHELEITGGVQYSLCYEAKAAATRTMNVNIDNGEPSYDSLMGQGEEVMLGTHYQSYKHTFFATASDENARLTFNMGKSDISIQIDNVGIFKGDMCGQLAGDNGSSSSSSSSSSGSNASSGGTMIGFTIEAEEFNQNKAFSYQVSGGLVEYFNGGSYLCYDNIDLTGINSVDVTYARDNPHDRPARIGIYIDDPNIPTVKGKFFDITKEPVLGEKNTVGTGGWQSLSTLNVGITPTTGVHTLCLVGIYGGGVGNLDKFTLSSQPGSHNGKLDFTFKAPTVAPKVEKITTSGNKVLFDGVVKSIAGPSLFWGSNYGQGEFFYNAETVKAFKDNWNAKLVRAAIGVEQDNAGILNDYFGHKKRAYDVTTAAIENGMHVIVDWHTHHAEDYENEAIEFFTDIATKYGQYDNVIYEIYNEPLSVSWSGTIKPYAERVIAAIRKIDPDNLIIVGTPTWSQRVDQAADDPIKDDNVAYTLHFYSATHRDDLRGIAQTALNKGIPLFVTEWGMSPASGNGGLDISEANKWMSFLKQNNISHANWSVSDFESSSIFNPGVSIYGAWGDGDLSPAGIEAKRIISNW